MPALTAYPKFKLIAVKRRSPRLAAILLAAMVWLMVATPLLPAQAPQQRGITVLQQPSATMLNGAYYALVVGINQYQQPLPNLKTALNDAQSIAQLLRESYGFQVQLLLNQQATRGNILNALSLYRRRLWENDNLLIYYAGHGYSDPEANKAYWLPADADSETPANWIIADELTSDIRVLPARHVLIVSDSCYSGGLTRDADVAVKPSDQKTFLSKMLAGRSRTLMASGGNEPVSDGGGGAHSVFADAVLTALEQASGDAFTAGELFHNYVQQRVAGRSEQIPQYSFIRNSDHDDGDFVFTRKAGSVPAPNSVPLPPAPPPSPAAASVNLAASHWEELTQAPPKLTAMVIHGKTLIGADGAAQIYRSQDSGIHWTAAPMPDPKATVVALASCGSLLFAGATNEGKPNDVPLYISQDDGASWKPTGLEGNRVTAVGCSGKQVEAGMWPRTVRESAPAQPSTSYPPGSPAAVMLGTGRSANTPQYRAVNLKGDPVGDMVHATLVVSNDGGETWELLRKTFDLVSVRVTDQRIEVFGRDNSVLAMPSAFVLNYCYDAQDKTCAKIYSKYSGALPTALQKMDQTVFVGTRAGSIMVSRNEGAAWKEMLLPLPTEAPAGNGAPRISGFPTSVDAMTLANHHVVAGTGEKGVYLSDIAGDNWTMVGEHALSRLRCLQYDGAFLYAGTLEGVYRIRLIEAEH